MLINGLDVIAQLLVASAILEAVWETIKMIIWPENRENLITRIGTILIGLYLAFSYNLDLLKFLGLTDHIPYSGVILSGILISRGSSFVHDLLTKTARIKETLAVLTPVDLSKKTAPDNLEPAVKISPIQTGDV